MTYAIIGIVVVAVLACCGLFAFLLASDDPAGQPMVQRHGSWKESDGYSDDAADASAEHGARLFELIVREVAEELLRFHRQPLGPADPAEP